MIKGTIPKDIKVEPRNEQKETIFKTKYISIDYYPERVIHPKYYLEVLKDKILFPFLFLKYKFRKKKYFYIKKK